MNGLDNVHAIGGSFWLDENTMLTSLSGLDNLETIGGNFLLRDNDSLNSIAHLSNLTSIGGGIEIIDNPQLSSLSGIDQIEDSTISSLYITNNLSLSTCEVESICAYLSAPNGLTIIFNNKTGCNSETEVLELCQLVSVSPSENNAEVLIYPNPANGNIHCTYGKDIELKELNIYNLYGQLVMQKKEQLENIDITPLQKGMYIIEFSYDFKKSRQQLSIY